LDAVGEVGVAAVEDLGEQRGQLRRERLRHSDTDQSSDELAPVIGTYAISRPVAVAISSAAGRRSAAVGR
jgi:hypothetical protein